MIPKKIIQSEGLVYYLLSAKSFISGMLWCGYTDLLLLPQFSLTFWEEEENLYLIRSFSLKPLFLCIMICSYFTSGNKSFSSLEQFVWFCFRIAVIKKTLAE